LRKYEDYSRIFLLEDYCRICFQLLSAVSKTRSVKPYKQLLLLLLIPAGGGDRQRTHTTNNNNSSSSSSKVEWHDGMRETTTTVVESSLAAIVFPFPSHFSSGVFLSVIWRFELLVGLVGCAVKQACQIHDA
jgi:hypothetical protein